MNDNMLEFGGDIYILDFEALDKFLFVDDKDKKTLEIEERDVYNNPNDLTKQTAKEVIRKEYINDKEINGIRYELITDMLNTIFSSSAGDDEEDLLGPERALSKTPLSYKMAFNTLIKYKIIKKIEE